MGVLRINVVLACFALVTGKLLLREPLQHVLNASSDCVPLRLDRSGASYTANAKLGGKSLSLVVDTGSPYILIMSNNAPGATSSKKGERTITYGSGSVLVHEATDELQIGPNDFDETIFLSDGESFGFPDIDGIYPLGQGADKIIHSKSFSVCFNGNSGNLAFGTKGTSVAANSRWEAKFTGIKVDGTNVGVSSKFLPDTGTTLIMAPLGHLDKLFATLCSKWSGCGGDSAVDFIDSVRKSCSGNLPSIEFSLGGSTKISLSSKEYLLHYGGKCDVAFTYGDEWILGMPLFLAHQVVFDYSGHKIGLQSGCGCGGSLKEDKGPQSGKTALNLKGPPRVSPFVKPQPQLTAHEASNENLVELARMLSLERFQKA